jgi:fructose-bisphosphate aldolase class I
MLDTHGWTLAFLWRFPNLNLASSTVAGATPRRRGGRAISSHAISRRRNQKHIMLLLPVTGMHGYVALAHAVSPSAATSRPAPPAAIRMVSTFERYNRFTKEMRETAQKLSRPGHGILATDESTPTVGRRLDTIGIENTEANRRVFREMLYTTPGLGDYISGVIMFDETLYQRTEGLGRRPGGVKFTKVLEEQGILPGIKVDTGLQRLAGTDGETATQGLDGLGERCKAYYAEGARFAKWRAVLKISPTEGMPSERAIAENAQALGRYASICQEHGLVPIVEPEVTLGPGDYSIERAAYETERVLSHVFRALNTHDVILECMLLKPSMVLPGLDATLAENDRDEVARLTVQTMMRTVPPAVPGIFFLSGGMGSEEATQNLQNLQKVCPNAPWRLTFSYGRALQESVLQTWQGKPENVQEAQELLKELARVNGEAQLGIWNEEHPAPGAERSPLPKLSYSSERREGSNLFNW